MKFLKVLTIIICLCLISTISSCKNEENIMEDYPGLTDKKHIIKEITPKELVEKVANKETFVAVLGFPECPWCQALMPEVNKVGKDLKLENIYYCNILDARDNPESKDKIYYLALYEYFEEMVDDEKDRINAPTTIKVKDGRLAGFHIDTVKNHLISDTGILPQLSNEQKNELHEILKQLFNK